MHSKIKVIVIFGGQSVEHEISLLSAKNVINSLDKNKYEVIPIGITKKGQWVTGHKLLELAQNATPASQIPANLPSTQPEKTISEAGQNVVVFPVLHGTNGEDGTIQGLLKLANVPFVGAGVLGSAIGMDKDVQKRLLRDAGIPTAKFMVLTTSDKLPTIDSFPVFVKPANAGSSVGVTKAHNLKEFKRAIKLAFNYDNKILIEEAIAGREIETSVLGNDNPEVSFPGEVIPAHEFYDYDAKYLDENGAKLIIPAKLTKSQITKIQKLAIKTYQVLCCEGMARVDMFLTPKGKVIINEINTIPGFTSISMYPKLWEASGLSYQKLTDKLISLALAKHKSHKIT